MKILTVANLKGGVGKSTLAIYLALALKDRGKRVLAVDLDPNNSLTDFFLRGADDDISDRNVMNVLQGEPAGDVVYKTRLDIDTIPATLSLHRAGALLAGDPGALLLFRKRLTALDYDYILIDTPPALTLEMRAGLYAADIILIPLAPVRWIRQGMDLLSGEIEKARIATRRKIDALIVPYMISKADQLVLQYYPEKKTTTLIPKRAELKNKTETGKILSRFSKSRADFANLAGEL